LSNEELQRNVDFLIMANRYLAVENEVIQQYLSKLDPQLLIGIDQQTSQMTLLSIQRGMSPTSRRGTEEVSSIHSMVRASTQLSTGILEKGPRINLSNKDDIVSREMDELKVAMDKLNVQSARQRFNLKAKVEEMQDTVAECLETQTSLEQVEQAIDIITGRIPAEKFIRHLEEWLKRADLMMEKLRLRTLTMRSMNTRAQQLLEEKEELGQNLTYIDFEKMQIDNRQLVEKTSQKNKHVLQLKKMAGQCNLLVTVQKKKMQEQMTEFAELQQELTDLENSSKDFDAEADTVEAEAAHAEDKFTALKDYITNYTAPEVLDYIKQIVEVNELQQAVKVWSRRKKIQQTALAACKKVLRNLKQGNAMADENVNSSQQ
ncbi:hypothetical protein L9F63_004719, partial [Diploptera punctata]